MSSVWNPQPGGMCCPSSGYVDAIDVTQFPYNADPFGNRPATAAFQQAIYAAQSAGKGSMIRVPAGKYLFPATDPSIDIGLGGFKFVGDGRDSSILMFNEGTNAAPKNLFVSAQTQNGVAVGTSIGWEGIGIQGSLQTNGWINQGGTPFFINYFRSVYIADCRFSFMANLVMEFEVIQNFQVQFNEFDSNMRDNCRARSSRNCFVVGNRFKNSDDDAIALHQADYINGAGMIHEAMIVDGNTLEDTCGIHCLGGRSIVISNNILRRVKATPITLGSDALEGQNLMFGINIHDNQLYDCITRPASFPGNQFAAIAVNYGNVMPPFGTPIPGQNTLTTQNFSMIFNFRDINYNNPAGATAFAPQYGISIKNNQILRTLAPVASYSTWGFGQTFSATGFINPAVTEADLRLDVGIVIEAESLLVDISGNQISGANYGIVIDAPTDNFGGRAWKICDNTMYDCILGGLWINTPGAVYNMSMMIDRNIFNLDPYCLNPGRGAAGTWATQSAAVAIITTSVTGLLITRNTFENCSDVTQSGNEASNRFKDNIVRCQPVTNGWSTTNKGVGNVRLAGPRFTYDCVYSDPTQTNYLQQMNTLSQEESSLMPTTGFWVTGTFVRNTNYGTAAYGYLRNTTGSGNVNETDWHTVIFS